MHRPAVGVLVLVLIGVPVAAAPSALSFAVELFAGTLAAAVPFYAVLYNTSDVLQTSRLAEPATEGALFGLVVPPLATGATVALAGRLFGVAAPLASFTAVLGAAVSEIFAIQLWRLDIPQWVKVIAVPAVTSLGATLAFNRQAR